MCFINVLWVQENILLILLARIFICQSEMSVSNQSEDGNNIHMYIVHQAGMVIAHWSIFLDRLIELLWSLES